MEIDCVNKRSFLKPNIFSSKLLIFNDKIKLTFDNSKNIFSLNKAKVSSKTFDLRFKDSFGFSPPSISRFNSNKNSTALWVRKNSYIIMSNVTLNKLISSFEMLGSVTDQTGGWLLFKIDGNGSLSLFEKLLSINLDNFSDGNCVRTSINKINCFVLCKKKFQAYDIICPISFSESMKSRLTELIKLT